MTPELLATALLATLVPIMKKGAESLAGTMLKDGWDQVKKRLSGQAGEDAARMEAGEAATPALQAEVATVLEKDPRLAAEIGREVERHGVQANGGVAVGTAQADKMIIMRDANTISF